MNPQVLHRHRIVPGHMGGTYEPSNVVRVSVAMHAAFHKDLWEHYGKLQDVHAWHMLTGLIGKAAHVQTPETRAKLRALHLGMKHTDAAKAKVGAAQRGRTHTADTRAKIRASQVGVTKTAEHREKLRASSTGQWASYSAEKQARILAAREATKVTNGTHKPSAVALAKLGARSKGNQYALGCKRSPETLVKMRAARQAYLERKRAAHVH